MGKNTLFIAILVLFDGAAIAWAAWEFWKLRPSADKADGVAAGSPESARHPEGEHGPHDG